MNDHLGNTRVAFQPNGTGGKSISQFADYYPLGSSYTYYASGTNNQYLYNGKELQDDVLNSTALDWYDYGARFYDPQIGRWHSVDPLVEKHQNYTPYAYVYNNPLNFIDPLGMDTLNVSLPKDRTKEGTSTLTTNGKNVKLKGGNNVLGKGTTNNGENPSRDPCETNGDTPTGEATVTTAPADRDPDANLVNSDGTPVENTTEQPDAQQKAEGRYFILLNPESGDILSSDRTQLGMHGGGTALGKNALQAKQTLVGTKGCLRFTNQTAAQIAKQVTEAIHDKRVFRVIITQQE